MSWNARAKKLMRTILFWPWAQKVAWPPKHDAVESTFQCPSSRSLPHGTRTPSRHSATRMLPNFWRDLFSIFLENHFNTKILKGETSHPMVPTWLTARKLEESLVIIFKRKNSKFYLSLTVSTQANMTKNLTGRGWYPYFRNQNDYQQVVKIGGKLLNCTLF